jgi:effector-binding domain-containing protein
MAYEIVLEDVAARPIAAVHSSVPVGHVAAAWRPALDKVWAFLRGHPGLRTDGHNIFVYHHPVRPGAPLEVDFGVEVSRAFAGEDEVVFAHTPAGHVASTMHIGPPDALASANAAIEAWCVAHQRSLAGVSWEIYGDPGDDPATLEVQVLYLLA